MIVFFPIRIFSNIVKVLLAHSHYYYNTVVYRVQLFILHVCERLKFAHDMFLLSIVDALGNFQVLCGYLYIFREKRVSNWYIPKKEPSACVFD